MLKLPIFVLKDSQPIIRLQRRVIRRRNCNFVIFQGLFLKIVIHFPIIIFLASGRGCLRPIWPQTYNISYLSCKYCSEIVFFDLKLIRGHFAIDQILLKKQGFSQFSKLSSKRQQNFRSITV